MFNTRIPAVGVTALLATSVALPALADDEVTVVETPDGESVTLVVAEQETQVRQVDIQIDAAPLSKFVDILRSLDPKFNAVLLSGDKGLVLPPMRLEGVSAGDVMEAIDGEIFDDRLVVDVNAFENDNGNVVYKVRVNEMFVVNEEDIEVETFVLRKALEEEEAESMMTLLDLIAESVPGEPKPTVQVHRKGGVVLLSGEPRGTQVLRDFLQQWSSRRAAEATDEQNVVVQRQVRQFQVQEAKFVAERQQFERTAEGYEAEIRRLKERLEAQAVETAELRAQLELLAGQDVKKIEAETRITVQELQEQLKNWKAEIEQASRVAQEAAKAAERAAKAAKEDRKSRE